MRVRGIRRSVVCGLASFAVCSMVATVVWAAEVDTASTAIATFATPDEAANAFVVALESSDEIAYQKIFGPDIVRLASTDKIAGALEEKRLADAARESLVLRPDGSDAITLVLGTKRWPFPIPIVKTDGTWHFDTAAGIEELINRRIGANELAAIELAQEYVAAQRSYALEDHEGDRVRAYAQRLGSTPGRRDGLYWESATDETPSPLGPFVAAAGDHVKGRKPGDPYKGYYFRILTRQGPHAPGGAYDYVINGHMVAGFALVAFPADYGSSGIMTFLVNQEGEVFEKDLGPKTAAIAGGMTRYDPDASWVPATSE